MTKQVKKVKRFRPVMVWGIKHLPTNEIVLPLFPKKIMAQRYSYDNYVAPSVYFKIVKVQITEVK